MQFKEQIRKHSNWSITAMTAGAITIVAATGIALADDGSSRGPIGDQINLQDRSPVMQGQAFQAGDGSATLVPGPIVMPEDSTNSFDSPLDAASPSTQSPASVMSASVASPASVDSVATQASLDSYDTPAAPVQAPVYEDSVSSFSADSFDSPS